jgi:sigma-E factor negative regulatory protein RseB
VAMIEQRGMLNSFPALLQAGDDGIADWYEVRAEGSERVAGHEANVLAIRARDGLRYGYRLWADRASGLLLRAEVVGERGDILETSAFSDVVIGIRPQPESVVNDMRKLEGYRVVRPVLTPTRLEAEGWAMRQVAPGFRPVSCVSRQIDAPGDAAGEGVAPPVIQSIYSDGLTYVSVFIEPFRAARHAKPMFASIGATSTLSQRHGDWWVTIIGDTPPATLKIFAAALERRKP